MVLGHFCGVAVFSAVVRYTTLAVFAGYTAGPAVAGYTGSAVAGAVWCVVAVVLAAPFFGALLAQQPIVVVSPKYKLKQAVPRALVIYLA